MPIAKRKSVKQTASKPVAKIAKKAKESSDEEAGSESKSEDDDDDHDNLPLAKRKKKEATQKKAGKSSKSKNTPVSRAKPTPKGKKKEESEESEGETSDEPASKKKRTSIKSERSSSKSSSKKKPKDESEEEEEAREKKLTKLQLEEKHIYKWWTPEEQAIIKMKEKKGIKWITLEHNGLLFPPEYEPHGVKMLYNGKPIELTPAAEEIATFYASMLDSDYTKKEKFNKNFMKDWLAVLNKDKKYKKNPHPIEKLELCDFTPIYKYLQEEKEKRKAMSKEEKKKIAEEKSKITEKYMFAKVDGHLEKVGNFRVEPPSLFRGRGDHPKMGKVKTRIYPEDVTINIGEDAPVPPCPIPGHRWGKVVHDNTATWLAHWKDTINGQGKYVFLAASSSFKMMSDFEKYEKARRLKSHVERIREEYTRDLQHANLFERQRATALYLIDRLALRVGNEKDEEQEADTVGCCSLRPEHLEFNDATTEVTFDFLGKDSIRYFNTVKVDQQVFKNMKQFVAKKDPQEDKIFDKLDTPELNKYLKSLMDGLTAKVFRTYNASITLDKLLHQDQKEGRTLNECLLDYNAANREVAILCNHQRAAPKNHEVQVQKIEERIKELEDERSDVKKWMKIAKREGSVTVDEKIKPKKKGDDDASADDDDPKTAKKTYTFEKLENRLKQLNTKIGTISNQLQIKDANKTVALGTSKINYMDPRITVAWCKKYDVPVSKIFNASLQVKFLWALDVDPDWRF
uniref:DNA topoisomerase I n=1 Tax=Cyanoptyche gloeocystis TaxID=77922 RepID=A0A7S2JNM3_9EUKA